MTDLACPMSSRDAERAKVIDVIVDRCMSSFAGAEERMRRRTFAARVLDALSAAGFAVVPKRLARELEKTGWAAVRPYHDISEKDIRFCCPGDFWSFGWSALVNAADLARPIPDPVAASEETT